MYDTWHLKVISAVMVVVVYSNSDGRAIYSLSQDTPPRPKGTERVHDKVRWSKTR